MHLYQRAQQEFFSEEFAWLKTGKEPSRGSRHLQLAPEYDKSCDFIRVGGRLGRTQDLPTETKYPIVTDSPHPITRRIIRDYDEKLLHYGPERILAEIRHLAYYVEGKPFGSITFH